jgi:hypothetical protein
MLTENNLFGDTQPIPPSSDEVRCSVAWGEYLTWQPGYTKRRPRLVSAVGIASKAAIKDAHTREPDDPMAQVELRVEEWFIMRQDADGKRDGKVKFTAENKRVKTVTVKAHVDMIEFADDADLDWLEDDA